MTDTTNGSIPRSDAKVAGEGTIGAGTYADIIINGAGTISGDVVCNALKVNGVGTCKGSVTADSATVNGTGSFAGQLHVGEMLVNGDASAAQSAGVGSLKVKGRMSISGGLAANAVDVRGELVVGDNVEADSFEGEGAFKIGGLLNAGRVSFRLHGGAQAREIGGENVTVLGPRGFAAVSLMGLFVEKRLTADVIEADDVTLEYTTAKVVRGARVSIGEGCKIDLVEYTESLSRLADAQIAEERKVTA